ncbi:hypothetical protein BCR43DRAFT_564577 [Syncephalastrum racemosum]|uniref:Uncharacterized protein n=1 Tax=Syncephalastrum racemosum TaxID=13706 RepID=A0A1X2HC50_SYNRA|nr:hypothetical protein BCR43DRAFT_564577 [Syncephalastrum racemosum]
MHKTIISPSRLAAVAKVRTVLKCDRVLSKHGIPSRTVKVKSDTKRSKYDSTILSEGADEALGGSAKRKRLTGPDTHARKGDFSAYTCDKHLSQLLFLMECKPPRSSRGDDLAKLSNSLKDCLDKAIQDGAENSVPAMWGLLCEGKASRYKSSKS